MIERNRINRRHFLQGVGGAVVATGLAGAPVVAEGKDRPAKRGDSPVRLKKAVKFGMVKTDASILDKFKLLKELGFDGVEMNSPSPLDRNEVLAARDKSGLPIHGVVNSLHWKAPLSHPDPAVREKCVDSIRTALRDAKAYGGSSRLLVPAKVDATMPYDKASTRSQAEIRKVVPLAEELGIRILIENVWNNFLLSPLEMARYIDEFASPVVGSYFDVGNVVRSGWPEQWIRILDKRIGKLDIKEYDRTKRDKEGLWEGFKVQIGEGSVNWPEVMKALGEINFSGWATAEVPGGDRDRLKDIADRMDRVLAT